MSGAATDYLENAILDHILGKVAYTAPTTIYVGLANAVAEDGTITGEPSGYNYSRVQVTNNTTNFPAASGGSKSNGADIVFNEASGSWGTINYVFLADADVGSGHVLLYAQLTNPKTIGSGDTVKFEAGDLTFSVD